MRGPGRACGARVGVPAPEHKQGVRAEPDDDLRADGVARPAGGEYGVSWVADESARVRVSTGIREVGMLLLMSV